MVPFTGGASLLTDAVVPDVAKIGPRALVRGMSDTIMGAAGLEARAGELTGLSEPGSAEDVSASRQALSAGGKKVSSGYVEDMASGVVSSLSKAIPAGTVGGTPAIVGGFVLDSMNEAYSEAKRAGKSHEAALSFAEREGLVEGVVTTAFSMAGLGGMEKYAGQAVKASLKEGVLGAVKQYGAEVVEENLTELFHYFNKKLSGVDPNAKFGLREAFDTSVQAVFGTAGAHVSGKVAGATEGPSRSEFKTWAQEQGVEITGRENATQRAQIMDSARGETPVVPETDPVAPEQASPPTEQPGQGAPAVETTPEAPEFKPRLPENAPMRARVEKLAPENRAALNKEVEAMPPEQRDAHRDRLMNSVYEAQFDPVSGVPTRRAFQESEKLGDIGPEKAALDVVGLGAGNDHIDYAMGDAMLKTAAQVSKEAGIDLARWGGDEFMAHGQDRATLREKIIKANKILAKKRIRVTLPDGTVREFKGLRMVAGFGKSTAAAASVMEYAKGKARESGVRPPKGQLPSYMVEVFEGGKEGPPRLRDSDSGREGESVEPDPDSYAGTEPFESQAQAPAQAQQQPATPAESGAGKVASDNIYMRMPLPEVKKQAAHGVRLAKEALKAREKPLPFIGEKPDVEVQGMGMGGAVPPAMVIPRQSGGGLKPVAQFLKTNFTGAGDMPKESWERVLRTKGEISAKLTDVQVAEKELQRAGDAAFGKDWASGEQGKGVKDVLAGDADIDSLPEGLHEPVRRMRRHLDSLSDEMIKAGVVQGKLVATVKGNKGVYLNRSYKSYTTKDWTSRVPEEVVNRAAAYIRSEYEGISDEEVNGTIHSLLNPTEDSLLSHISRDAKVGGKDLTMLKRRQGIAPEIRALMGEEQDPIKNYVRSAGKMISAIENHKMLTDLRAAGLGKYFFESKTSNADGNFTVALAEEGSKTMAPLDGLYTTKEIAAEFRRLRGEAPDFPAWLMAVSGVTKAGATVGNFPGGHIRNALGNTGFLVANGHFKSVLEIPKALKAIQAQLGNKPGAGIEYVKRLQRLGIIGEDIEAGQIHDILKGATSGGLDMSLPVGRAGESAAKKALRALSYSYQTADAIPKIMAFESELAAYKKAHPEWTDAKLDDHAAKIVHDTMPTYSRVSKGIKKLARFPFASDFVMFPAEVIRVTKNSIALARKELSEPKTRSMGVRRSVGLATQAAFIPAVAALARYLVGVLPEEDEALHEFAPSWSTNSDFMYTGRSKDGVPTYIDLSYMDPWQYFRKPINALWKDGAGEAALETASTFATESILTQAVADVMRNKKKASGGEIYNEQDTLPNKAKAIAAHLGKALEPGSLKRIEGIMKAISGEVNEYGKQYDLKQEVGSLLGNRPTTLNVPEALMFKGRQYLKSQGGSENLLRKKLGSKGKVTDKDILDTREVSERGRRVSWDDMKRSIWGARKLGMNEDEIYDSLQKALVPKKEIAGMMDDADDYYQEYYPHDAEMYERLEKAQKLK